MLSVSNPSDELLYNTDLQPKHNSVPETQGLASALYVEECKDGHRENQIAHAQDSFIDPCEELMRNEQTKQPPAAATAPDNAPKKQKKSGS